MAAVVVLVDRDVEVPAAVKVVLWALLVVTLLVPVVFGWWLYRDGRRR